MLHKIRSRAYLTGNDSVLAVADVNIDDAVIIRDCRPLKSADGKIEVQQSAIARITMNGFLPYKFNLPQWFLQTCDTEFENYRMYISNIKR